MLTVIALLCANDLASEKPKTVTMKKLFCCGNAFFFFCFILFYFWQGGIGFILFYSFVSLVPSMVLGIWQKLHNVC